MAAIALLVAAVFGFLIPSAQRALRKLLQSKPRTIWAVPFLLATVFAGAETQAGAFSWALTGLVLLYLLAPVAIMGVGDRGPGAGDLKSGGEIGPGCCGIAEKECGPERNTRLKDGRPDAGPWPPIPGPRHFIAILLLWLPLEFAAGASLVPRPAQGFLHSVAYGIAILLALVLFTAYHPIGGMKYTLPRSRADFWLPLAAFAMLAPVLAVLGVAIGFIPPPHLPAKPAGSMAGAMALIFAGIALPEEILFRSLIQNMIAQRFGDNVRSLAAASLIFGCAHLDNGPQALPNWRYMILATIAGVAYGRVFQKSSSVCSPAALHALVDWTKHFFF